MNGLQELIKRVERLEKAVFQSDEAKKVAGGTKTPATLADHIRNLGRKGFFKSAKTQNEVHEALRSTYECEVKRVGVELIRLHKKKELRKTSKNVGGKKLTAYVR